MSLGIAGSAEGNKLFQNCMENGYVLLGWGGDIDFSECKTPGEPRYGVNCTVFAAHGCVVRNALEWNDHSASLHLALHSKNRTLHPVQLPDLG